MSMIMFRRAESDKWLDDARDGRRAGGVDGDGAHPPADVGGEAARKRVAALDVGPEERFAAAAAGHELAPHDLRPVLDAVMLVILGIVPDVHDFEFDHALGDRAGDDGILEERIEIRREQILKH